MSGARIFLAGHRGMVGSAIHRQLRAGGTAEAGILTRTHAELDLTETKEHPNDRNFIQV